MPLLLHSAVNCNYHHSLHLQAIYDSSVWTRSTQVLSDCLHWRATVGLAKFCEVHCTESLRYLRLLGLTKQDFWLPPHCFSKIMCTIFLLWPLFCMLVCIYIYNTFIQTALHSRSTFSQFLLSLGIEPMTLVLLSLCFTVWATGSFCLMCHQFQMYLYLPYSGALIFTTFPFSFHSYCSAYLYFQILKNC